MLVIIDTRTSNLQSVKGALNRIGAEARIAANEQDIRDAEGIILPGVGAFSAGMDGMRASGLLPVLLERAKAGTPLLGICLGMQMLAEESEEHGSHPGLGLIRGRVRRLDAAPPRFRVPNIGWYDTIPAKAGTLFPDTSRHDSFYYVHSYHMQCDNPGVPAATISYNGENVVVAVESGSLFGVQFHPEKSQDSGLDLLSRFLAYVKGSGRV